MSDGIEIVEQATQLAVGDVLIGVIETLSDDGGPWAVLGYRAANGESRRIELEPGERATIEGVGTVELVAVVPSTDVRRGRVALRVTP